MNGNLLPGDVVVTLEGGQLWTEPPFGVLLGDPAGDKITGVADGTLCLIHASKKTGSSGYGRDFGITTSTGELGWILGMDVRPGWRCP